MEENLEKYWTYRSLSIKTSEALARELSKKAILIKEMANEQLNGGRAARDKLADGMAGAGLPDCVAPNAGASLLGLVTLPFAAATGKCKPPQ